MHSHSNRASNLRERHRGEVSARLIQASRVLTAQHGLNGFTVEQVCEAAGVSRRTFFNYFATKEDAIFGITAAMTTEDLDELFVVGRTSGDIEGLVDDAAALNIARWNRIDVTRENAGELFAAIEREPRLLQRLLDLSRAQELADIRLVARREGWAADDLRASALVLVLGTIFRAAAEDILTQATPAPFEEVFASRLESVRSVFSPSFN